MDVEHSKLLLETYMASKQSPPSVMSTPIIGTMKTNHIGAQSMTKATSRFTHGVYASFGNTHRGDGHCWRASFALAFIIDEEASIRQFVSLILQGGGVDTIEFVDGPSFRDTQIVRAPDLVFLNVNLEAQDAVQSIETLSRSDFAGAPCN